MEIDKESLKQFIEIALKEDIGEGDHTTLATIPDKSIGKAQLLVKQQGIIAGIEVAKYIFQYVDHLMLFNAILHDGDIVKPGDIAFRIEGKVHTILQLERLVLNIMQRMSGIATQTKQYADQLSGLKTRVLDTRKTTPGMRLLDKYAVKAGGGENHRIGLYDMILIKDNHIDFAGGIKPAIERTHDYLNSRRTGCG
jgi:nicotinate-nucleotide pyrophosphorylase (carboxylating)